MGNYNTQTEEVVMKSLFLTLSVMMMFVFLCAAPLRDVPTELTQPDGSVYPCFMTGDEYFHRNHDPEGYTIIQNPDTGWFVYADRLGPELVPTPFIPGLDDPAMHGLVPNLLPDETILQERYERFHGPSGDDYGRSPTIGTVNNINIFIRFSDQTEYTDNLSTYNTMFNSTTSASVKGFFLEDSNNQLTVNTTFYPPAMGGIVCSYQDPNPRNYYKPWSTVNPIGYTTIDQGFCRLHLMLINAIVAITPLIPPTLNIDADNDGSVDNIGFICQGGARRLGGSSLAALLGAGLLLSQSNSLAAIFGTSSIHKRQTGG
jgi:hypothetical protein